jgi:hypothetical protein
MSKNNKVTRESIEEMKLIALEKGSNRYIEKVTVKPGNEKLLKAYKLKYR